jgi:peptidoglycan hydrolase-like protein with peptidoglycan-binding domain
VTQPVYLDYPVYPTYPVETAVQVALQQIGLYSGPIDGRVSSCRGAIETYQQQNALTVTGTINPELLKALGIQANPQAS